MNAPAFTPGPWVVREDEFDGLCVHAPTIERMTDCSYAVVSSVNGDETPTPKYGTPEANANLIAAAPELYEALRQFMALDQSFSDATDAQLDALIARGESVRMAKAVKAAKAALAKAVQS